MKVFLLHLLFFTLTSPLFAQTLNGKDFTKIESEYIRMVSNQDESDIYIDFGTRYNAPRFNNRLADPSLRNTIKDKNGHEIIFASVVDALNFMAKQGYTLIETHKILDKTSTLIYYIMKKEN
ncbi:MULTISPECIES: hypothetical protein [unclassified Aureispira]|uniref:hypothetical protein n=1 Tax=unclassified Aureispira TaxID=2649989 RepID=UPI0006986612|nr:MULTISPECIES: hypothetical protein [unclassified Aureispira]WMX16432.1 hypothetical protein QP953_08635 [Aureispira sp. CCB-E]